MIKQNDNSVQITKNINGVFVRFRISLNARKFDNEWINHIPRCPTGYVTNYLQIGNAIPDAFMIVTFNLPGVYCRNCENADENRARA